MTAAAFNAKGYAQQATGAPPPAPPKFLSTAGFMEGFKLPSYVIDGILLRGNLYSLTAPTGHGKTAVGMCLAFMKATGVGALNGGKVERGKVVYLAAENPDDIRMRVLLMTDRLGLDPNALPIEWVAGAFDLDVGLEEARQRASEAELIIVDTGAAFALQSGTQDENDNAGQLRFAKQLRAFTELECRPGVLTLMHPVKHASCREHCLPRGGGSFIAEVDGNLSLWADGDRTITELHWTGKIRGPDFDAISFVVERGTCAALTDAKGRQLQSVWAYPADRFTVEQTEERQRTDEDNLLMAMKLASGASIAALCEYLGWIGGTGRPQKSRAAGVLDRLAKERLVEKSRGHWALTAKGEKELKRDQPASPPHPAAGMLRNICSVA